MGRLEWSARWDARQHLPPRLRAWPRMPRYKGSNRAVWEARKRLAHSMLKSSDFGLAPPHTRSCLRSRRGVRHRLCEARLVSSRIASLIGRWRLLAQVRRRQHDEAKGLPSMHEDVVDVDFVAPDYPSPLFFFPWPPGVLPIVSSVLLPVAPFWAMPAGDRLDRITRGRLSLAAG